MESNLPTFHRGDQIAYVPSHANGDMDHPDVDYGFVYNVNKYDKNLYFCRYWSKYEKGELRTKANSESTHARDLRLWWSVPQGDVNKTIEEIDNML